MKIRHALTAAVPLCLLFTGCTSLTGGHLDGLYLSLLWIGAAAGYIVSDLIWANDDSGAPVPVWEVVIWFVLTGLGAFLGYIKRFTFFSGFLIAFAVPVAGMYVSMLIVRVWRKHYTR